METTCELCQKWTPAILTFNPKVFPLLSGVIEDSRVANPLYFLLLLNAFQRVTFGSKLFET
jgi:hypothetical protein